LLMANLTLFMP